METGLPGAHDRRRLRILCAEDNAMVGDLLVRLLAMVGHQAELAADGLAAWERLSQAPGYFDLLVTDHQMPRMDGLDLVRWLRRTGFPGGIIVHSSALGATEVEAYRALSVDSIIKKATGAENLLRAIETVCAAR